MILKLRFRCIPSYGNGVIRKFANNTSEMKRLAARDFEDMLQVCHANRIMPCVVDIPFQCAMPVFEGLFPEEHDAIVQSLLYRFAQWHALAKLRMHSETTLSVLDATFKRLCGQLRKFRDFTCNAFTTVELPKERAARVNKAVRERSRTDNPDAASGRKVKKFNMNTYKFHAMGDYVPTIRLFGTIDSFTSQIVRRFPLPIFFRLNSISDQGELAHRALKAFYPLTSKLDTPAQLAKHERRRRVLRRVAETGRNFHASEHALAESPVGLKDHHYIPTLSRNNPLYIFSFLRDHADDPAVAVSAALLITHLAHRDV